MDENTPATPAAPEGNPIQDDVKGPTAKGPATKGAAVKGPAVHGPPAEVTAPARPKGPNASAIVVGLVAMVFAGLIIAKETMGLRIDWSRLGPGAIVGIGVVMVVIGAIGLVRRHDDV
jgi:hypothetical protein